MLFDHSPLLAIDLGIDLSLLLRPSRLPSSPFLSALDLRLPAALLHPLLPASLPALRLRVNNPGLPALKLPLLPTHLLHLSSLLRVGLLLNNIPLLLTVDALLFSPLLAHLLSLSLARSLLRINPISFLSLLQSGCFLHLPTQPPLILSLKGRLIQQLLVIS